MNTCLATLQIIKQIKQERHLVITSVKKKHTAVATENRWKARKEASVSEGRESWFHNVMLWNFAFIPQQLESSSDLFRFSSGIFFPKTYPEEARKEVPK